MKTIVTLPACLALFGILSLGCNQSKVSLPAPQTNAVAPSTLKHEPAERDSNVVLASHQNSDGGSNEHHIRLTVKLVEFLGSPEVDAALKDLWSDASADAENPTDRAVAKCRVMSSGEISKLIAGLEKQGLAKSFAWWKKDVASGQPDTWGAGHFPAGLEFRATPTVQPDNRIQVAFKVPTVLKNSSPTSNRSDDLGSNLIIDEFRDGQALVVAGPISIRVQAEVTRVPYLGDIPFVGDQYFSKRTFRKQTIGTLYLVTAEMVPQ